MDRPQVHRYDTLGALIEADNLSLPPLGDLLGEPREQVSAFQQGTEAWADVPVERRGSIRETVKDVAWKGITSVLNWLNNVRIPGEETDKPLSPQVITQPFTLALPPQHTRNELGYKIARRDLPFPPNVPMRVRNRSHED